MLEILQEILQDKYLIRPSRNAIVIVRSHCVTPNSNVAFHLRPSVVFKILILLQNEETDTITSSL